MTSSVYSVFKTDSDEDVIFVSEKSVPKSIEIKIDQVKRLALQRQIDQESRPLSDKALITQKSVAVEGPVKTKMEEEKGEDNLVKKERKPKKGKLSQPENTNCTIEDGRQTHVKKEKKSKQNDSEAVKEECLDGNSEKKKKKNKKRKIDSDSLTETNGYVVDEEDKRVIKKKKKKQHQQLDDSENQAVMVQTVKKDKVENKQKEKKTKNKSIQSKPENIKKEEEEEQQIAKKVKKVKNNISGVNLEQTEHVKEKKKKEKESPPADEESKKKTNVAENGLKLKISETKAEEVKLKKKTKKEAKSEKCETGLEVTEIKGKKKKREVEGDNIFNIKKDKFTKSETVTEEGKTEVRKKGINKKNSRTASVEEVCVEEIQPKKKQKEEEEVVFLSCEEVEVQSKKRKKKKSSLKVKQTISDGVEPNAKKKKKIKVEPEDQQELPQVDVVFLSEKCGNTDEITINQERRQALQMEVDKASQPEKKDKPTGLGQWSTAQFDNSEQQKKFLRLMGGFKKGFQPADASTGGGNMAMGKNAQQQLKQGLLGEFERAHSRRMDFSNRGAGLGFTAPSNKKFSIDASVCRSVRFDD